MRAPEVRLRERTDMDSEENRIEEAPAEDLVGWYAENGYEPFRHVLAVDDVPGFVHAVVDAADKAVDLKLDPSRYFGPFKEMVESVLTVAVSMALEEQGPGNVDREDVLRMLEMEAEGPLDGVTPDSETLMGAYVGDEARKWPGWSVARPCWEQDREGIECGSLMVREYTSWRALAPQDRAFALQQAFECVRFFGPGYVPPQDRDLDGECPWEPVPVKDLAEEASAV